MSEQLVLEILNGPLDGAEVLLTEYTVWGRAGNGLLSFPWDAELGDSQACFTPEKDGWYLKGLEAPHGTYRINHEQRLTGSNVKLESGDILRAHKTWLLVHEVK